MAHFDGTTALRVCLARQQIGSEANTAGSQWRHPRKVSGEAIWLLAEEYSGDHRFREHEASYQEAGVTPYRVPAGNFVREHPEGDNFVLFGDRMIYIK